MFDKGLQPHPLEDPRIAHAYMEKMFPGPDGLLCCLTNMGEYFTLRDAELTSFLANGEACVQDISAILPDPDAPGTLYIGTSESVLYHGDLTQDVGHMDAVDISPLVSIQ